MLESTKLKISLFDTNGRKIEEYNLNGWDEKREKWFLHYAESHFSVEEYRKGLYWSKVRDRVLAEWRKENP